MSVGWRMECKHRLADGERRLSAEMMGALAGRWSASIGWWRALAGNDDDASVGWGMECKRRLTDGKRRLAAMMLRASGGGWSASVAGRW